MIDKTAINQRFTSAVNNLISVEKTENKTSIAEKIKISKSKFSEILNNRMSIGLEDLAKFCEVFEVNANWILTGKGEMLNNILQNFVQEPNQQYNFGQPVQELLEMQRQLLQMKDEKIAALERELEIRQGNANAS